MGKPYGLGSVKIEYDLELDNRLKRYEKLFSEQKWALHLSENVEENNNARTAFSFWLTEESDSSFDAIDVQERIQELLMLLSWKNHPPKEKTRYQELDEFKSRPVLPSPNKVFGAWLKQATQKVYVPTDAPPEKLKRGDAILASFYYKDKDDVYLQCKHHGAEDLCVVRVNRQKRDDYTLSREGSEHLLKVLKLKKEYGDWVIECETIKQ